MTNLDDPWRIVRERAGIGNVRIHDCRHSFASRALALGESLPVIAKLLGHSQIRTTAWYAHLARDSVKASAARVAASIAEDFLTLKGDRRKVLENSPIRLQAYADRSFVTSQGFTLPFPAAGLQHDIEIDKVAHPRKGDHESPPGKAHHPLDLALVVPLAGAAISILEHIVRLQDPSVLDLMNTVVGEAPRTLSTSCRQVGGAGV